MDKTVIGIDIGTNSVKALLLTNGQITDQASSAFRPDFLGEGRVEQCPNVWWEAVKEVILKLTTAHNVEIAAIACAGQMHSSVFLDNSGNVIRKAILWNDTRTTTQTAQITESAGGESKLLNMVYNRSMEGFTLPKILWLRDNEPENFARLDKIIMPKDYINYKLTGCIATDISDAAGTGIFDVANGGWSIELAKAVGLDTEIFPKVLQSADIVGNVLPQIARELGISPEAVVLAGGADNSCAAIGNGMLHYGQAVISIGTSGTVIAMLENLPDKFTGDIHLFNYSRPDAFYAMGCMLCAGEGLMWLRSIFASKDNYQGSQKISLDDFDTLAKSISPGSGGLLFLPYLFGERCPVCDSAARGVFFGLSNTTTQSHMVRAVMEGVGYNIRAMFEMIESIAPINEIFITGGGAKSPVWVQIIADILGRALNMLNIEEGPAFGAALIAAAGAGIYADFESAKADCLKIIRQIKPNRRDIYERHYGLFRELYTANRELFKLL
ncbi:MAG: xylulokinase [Defluviitaleaceae bacterium]|nr:xylulokinase [Defluviitaleaceae bacterium]